MKALIIAGKYSQDVEVFYPLYRMQEEGWIVDIATKGKQEVLGVYGMPIRPTTDIPTNFNEWDVLILTGGARALEYLRQEEHLIQQIRNFGGTIGSICHGTQLLISAKRTQGIFVTGYYSIRDDIVNAGGFYPAGDAPYTTDGKIVSSSHYKHLGPFMKELIRVALS